MTCIRCVWETNLHGKHYARVSPSCSKKEKQDVDELELPDTRALFLESGVNLEDKKAKEMQEYLDAVNKEVIALSELNGASYPFSDANGDGGGLGVGGGAQGGNSIAKKIIWTLF